MPSGNRAAVLKIRPESTTRHGWPWVSRCRLAVERKEQSLQDRPLPEPCPKGAWLG